MIECVTRDGQQLAVHLYPDPGPAAPAVVVWPAMGVPARFYRPFATALVATGLFVCVADLRGTGASVPRPSRRSRYGYRELVGDIPAVLAALRPRLDGRRLVLLGHSLGGQACVLHLARSGQAVDGLALVAAGVPYWRRYGAGQLGVLGFTQGIAATTALLGVWPGWGFGGRQARGVIRDWASIARTGRLPVLDGVDTETAAATVRVPVLAVSLERDPYKPAPAVDHLVDKLAGAPVQRAHFDGAADHFTWARDPDSPVVAAVAAFANRG